MAFVDATIASIVASAENFKAAWDHLHTSFAKKSQTRIFSPTGSPVNNEELVVKIFSGLGPEFREISAAIRERDSPISYAELFNKLLDHEVFLKHEDQKKTTTQVTTAASHYVTYSQSASRNTQRPPNNNNWSPPN
ncbi:uncharacterized protein LOC125868487 [Solanum stenotomum]|uniref:uncharacterized protein LOC125868487 n=1 Tax=Solanum stenotomum TaxID=172797 RepID=UPI0020D00A55|nr:uncharacterized protein LOC125868487 [Solanum stenotomum]